MLFGIVVILLAAVGIAVFSWHPALAAIAPPAPNTFSPQQIDKGAVLAGIGNCASCHTVQGGAAFAGGLPLVTPFGSVYSSNITPDQETGIGSWSLDAFKRALHEGVRRDGDNLFPTFPYTHFVHVTDDDVTALYAYFMTRPAIKSVAIKNTLPFPLSLRPLQSGWKLLYFDQTPLQTNSAKSVDWNRGRYLAEGLAHCADCHTPRNRLGAEEKANAYGGADIDGWFSPALTKANPSPLAWSESDIYTYLRSGAANSHGVAVGPMAEVIHRGLAVASDDDIHALAVYFSDINGTTGVASDPVQVNVVLSKVLAQSAAVTGLYNNRGASLYIAACASCHTNSNGQTNSSRPELGLSSTLLAPNPDNLVHVILDGIDRHDGTPGLMMPGFAAGLSNDDITQLAAYLRSSRTALQPWEGLNSKVAALRHGPHP